MKSIRILSLVLATFCTATAHAQSAPIPIRIADRPALWWSLPFYIATTKGWWAEAGLAPTFTVYPSGPPQVAALQADAWDVSATGVAPAVLGASRFGLKSIAIANDESTANALMVKNDLLPKVQKDPSLLKGQKILLIANSTSDYATQTCLKKWGLSRKDVQLVNLAPTQIVSAITSNNGEYAGVWAPDIYTLQEKGGSSVLCSGKDAGVVIPSMVVASRRFAAENPQAVARFLAVYLRGWSWIKAHPKEARAELRKYYAAGGVDISDAGIEAEFQRPYFLLDGQLDKMSRSKGASAADQWLTAVNEFMVAGGVTQKVLPVNEYITDEFLKLIQADPKLSAMASRTD